MTNMTGGVVVAMAKQAERRVVDALRQHGATSAAKAIPLAIARPGGKAALRRLMSGGAVVAAGDRYWLDESRYEGLREKRRVSAVIALIVVALIIAGIVLFGATSGR